MWRMVWGGDSDARGLGSGGHFHFPKGSGEGGGDEGEEEENGRRTRIRVRTERVSDLFQVRDGRTRAGSALTSPLFSLKRVTVYI